MNRCIVCHRIVTRNRAQAATVFEDHGYLTCCPLCLAEFKKDPQKYVEIANLILGTYAANAYSTAASYRGSSTLTATGPGTAPAMAAMLKNLRTHWEASASRFPKLLEQLAQVSESGISDEARVTMSRIRESILHMQRQALIHKGGLQVLASLTES